MQAAGRECVAEQLHPPPPILSHKNTPPPPSAYRTPWQCGPHTNKHLVASVLVDVWLLFFSKKVNFMEDLRRENVCRSDVALLETMLLWRYFFSALVA